MNLISSQIKATLDRLTVDNWRKGNYFRYKNNTLCMCVHGALQLETNPEVKNIVNSRIPTISMDADPVLSTVSTGANRAVAYVVSSLMVNVPQVAKQNIKKMWDDRPNHTKQNIIINTVNYGKTEAHYLLSMVGLTTTFNDNPSTTLEMVKAKLLEALELAESLGV